MKRFFRVNLVKDYYYYAAAGLTTFLAGLPAPAFASDLSTAGLSGTVSVDWPWTKFLNSLAMELTGPIPKVLGIMGICGASIAMFSGHAGGGTQKFIALVFAISICLFAPTFIQAIMNSGSGMTIVLP